MPLAPITTWRIHIGAHKTATTHVQEILTLMRPQLVERGIDFVDNHTVRRSGLAKALFARRIATRLPVLRGRAVAALMAEYLDPLRAGPDAPTTMVLSEEKLMGGSLHVFSDPFYPPIERIVPKLASLATRAAGGADVTLFLSIRSFDGQMPSAYVQELKFSPPIAGGFENIKPRVLARPPSWFELVRRIRAAAPAVPLRVWRQEDYRRDPAAILAALCGRDPGPLPAMEDPYWTKSPDLAAVRAAEALPHDLPRPERRARGARDLPQFRRRRAFRPLRAGGEGAAPGRLRRGPRADRGARSGHPDPGLNRLRGAARVSGARPLSPARRRGSGRGTPRARSPRSRPPPLALQHRRDAGGEIGLAVRHLDAGPGAEPGRGVGLVVVVVLAERPAAAAAAPPACRARPR